ncbi:MAG: hypothetical protein OJF49_001279 [Ktedonobacterales bacterium]|nr:MAG: hypothetical protein OJF49_001279 [Ktedonobacterales bacterium]
MRQNDLYNDLLATVANEVWPAARGTRLEAPRWQPYTSASFP